MILFEWNLVMKLSKLQRLGYFGFLRLVIDLEIGVNFLNPDAYWFGCISKNGKMLVKIH